MTQKSNKSTSLSWHLISIICLLYSCAQVVNPSGGGKDVIPPKILQSVPENFSTNFKENSLILSFDEYIQIKDWNQVIISPPLSNAPKTKIRGKSLFIQWQDTLLDATTYTFNFGNAIVDNNEGNPLDSNLFVFSTGNYLDSLTIKGFINDITNQKGVKDALVMLYKNTVDSVPYLLKPDYFGKTKSDGSYSISFVKNGTYRLLALKDKNQNYLFDPEELIAFSDSLLKFESDTSINLNLFNEEIPKIFVKKTSVQFGKITIVFNKPIINLEHKPLNIDSSKTLIIEESSVKKDSLNLWISGEIPDSLYLVVNAKDFTDTLGLELIRKSNTAYKGRGGNSFDKLLLTGNASQQVLLDYKKPFILSSNTPISSFISKNIFLINTIDTLKYTGKFEDDIMRHYTIDYPFIEDSTYNLFIEPGALTDIFGNINDTINLSFKIQKKEYYGNLEMKISLPDSSENYIFQLINEKKTLSDEKIVTAQSSHLKFNLLPPGQYSFKLIKDSNKNEKWDTGNYLEKIQPEEIYFYESSVTIRSNWDLELEWEVK